MKVVTAKVMEAATAKAMEVATAIVLAIIWLKHQATRFATDSRAVSTVEYALIVIAVIAIVGVAAGLLGGQFKALFNTLGNEIQAGVNTVKSAVS